MFLAFRVKPRAEDPSATTCLAKWCTQTHQNAIAHTHTQHQWSGSQQQPNSPSIFGLSRPLRQLCTLSNHIKRSNNPSPPGTGTVHALRSHGNCITTPHLLNAGSSGTGTAGITSTVQQPPHIEQVPQALALHTLSLISLISKHVLLP